MFYRLLFIFSLIFLTLPLHAKDRTLLILGDSLSAAYGIPVESGWVALLQQRIQEQGYSFNVVNASISGETTIGAKNRLDKILNKHHPDIVIVELGGNDGLRGFPFEEIEQNLIAIVKTITQNNARALLVPMQLPPNYGQIYNQKFREVYARVANEPGVSLSTFILENIAINKDLMQADGIHPVAGAQPMMLNNIWPQLEKLLQTDVVLQ